MAYYARHAAVVMYCTVLYTVCCGELGTCHAKVCKPLDYNWIAVCGVRICVSLQTDDY